MFTIVTRLKVMLEVKKPPANADDIRDTDLILGFGKIPWRRKWQLTPVFLPGKFHGQRNLVAQGVAKSQTRLSNRAQHT